MEGTGRNKWRRYSVSVPSFIYKICVFQKGRKKKEGERKESTNQRERKRERKNRKASSIYSPRRGAEWAVFINMVVLFWLCKQHKMRGEILRTHWTSIERKRERESKKKRLLRAQSVTNRSLFLLDYGFCPLGSSANVGEMRICKIHFSAAVPCRLSCRRFCVDS